jgi:GWxTD domain-containing protein
MPDVTRRAVLPLLGLCLLAALLPGRARAAYLEPLDGRGNFHSYVDVVNRWRDDQHLDVVVLISVANGDLATEDEDGRRVGRLRVVVTLTGPDGREVTRTRNIRTRPLSAADAASRTLRQVCGVLLTDVPFRSGRLACSVYDVNHRRTGLVYQLGRADARSESVGEWYAEDSPRPPEGLALGDPLFLIQAPLAAWNPDATGEAAETAGFLTDYVHPSRIYGLEQDRLQLALPVWPPAGGTSRPADLAGLRLEIVSDDGIYALHDSVSFDARGRAALETGRPATLFYDLDVNDLPAGTYRLSLAPLSAQGRGVVSGFSVIWELGQLARHHDLVQGEGSTVFEGAERERFLQSSPTEREAMLDEFWRRLNPEPDNPVNRVQLEFQYRLAYVQQFLGGIGPDGARDARGEVFLLLGAPDEVQREPMPVNYRDQDDARVQVYDRFAPERPGQTAKGVAQDGTSPASPYETLGGIPLVDQPSRTAERDRQGMLYRASHNHGFEMWRYDRGGAPLFVNRLSHKGMGQRFLFVDSDGTGNYRLESSNVVQADE